jgi:uncharacterized integral membrane protein
MKRWLTILLALLVVFAAIVFSAINTGAVVLDLYLTRFEAPAGVLVLAAVFLGCVLGGLVLYPGVIVPMRMRIAALRRELERHQAPPRP